MHRNEIATACSATLLDEIQSEKFPSWFYNKVFSLRQQKSPDVTEQLWSLASGSSISVKSYPGCVINGVKYLTHQRDINRTTQNSGISVKGPGDQMYYGILEEIYDVLYIGGNSVFFFKCKWFDNRSSRRREKKYKNITSIYVKDTWYENEPFILASQSEQVFYVDDLLNGPNWKVVQHFCHRHIWEPSISDVIEDVTEDTITRDLELFVELPPIESSMGDHSNVQPSIVTSNVDAILNDNHHEEDDFINDAEDATIHEYANDEEVPFDNDYDDDIEEVYTENVDNDNE